MKKNFALLALTGVVALASCSQNDATTTVDTEKPTVTLSVNKSALTNAGGDITLTGTVKDNVGVTAVNVTRDGVTACAPTPTSTTDGTFSCTVTLNSNTGTAAQNYNFTATARDAAGNTGTSTAVSVSVAAPAATTTPPTTPTNPVATAVLTIDLVGVTSAPVTIRNESGAIVQGYDNVTVTDMTTLTVPRGVYTVSAGTVSGYAGPTSNSRVDLSGGNQTVILTYTQTTPNTPVRPTGTFSFNPDQRIDLVDAPGGPVVEWMANGWRVLAQGVSTGEQPASGDSVYVKGIIDVTCNSGTDARKVELLLARTSGTDVPNRDEVQAADVLWSGAAGGTAKFDTTRLAEYEGVPMWLACRVTGADGTQTLNFQRVIVDNYAPQPAVPDVEGIQNSYSGFRGNFNANGENLNYARGDVRVFTTNPALQDRLYGVAPGNSVYANRIPSGFESIRYYFVPETAIANEAQDSDEMRLAQTVKRLATLTSDYVQDTAASRGRQYNTSFGSGSNTTLTNTRPLDGVTYRVYAISRDQLGNEAASPTFVRLRFDNVGPVINGSALTDISPLPFPSLSPTTCISDVASVSLGSISDAGIGLDSTSRVRFTIGGIELEPGATFDTNRLPDGPYRIDYGLITDLLGNPATGPTNATVYIDNTDPSVGFNRPTGQGRYQSGEVVTTEAFGKDEGCGVYETRLFWDNNVALVGNGAGTDETPGTLGHPVEFARKTLDTARDFTYTDATNIRDWTLNGGWDSLTMPGMTSVVQLRALAIDRAGNVGVNSTSIVVSPKFTNYAQINLGQYDGHLYNEFPNPMNQPGTNQPNVIQAVGFNGTTLRPNTTTSGNTDNVLSLYAPTTGTLNGIPKGTTDTAGTPAERLKSVYGYGRFDAAMWDMIRTYQTQQDPTLTRTTTTGGTGQNNMLRAQRAQINQWRAPWLKVAEGMPAGTNQFYQVSSDLLNNFYYGRTFPNTLTLANTSYDEFNAIVSDTAGSYVFFGEKVQR